MVVQLLHKIFSTAEKENYNERDTCSVLFCSVLFCSVLWVIVMVPATGHNVCSASEAETGPGPVIESVFVDLESFRTNPWSIFGMYVTISPAPANALADMTIDIAVHSLAGSMIPDHPIGMMRLPGRENYRGLLTFAHDPTSIATNHDGSFASSMLTLRHNASVDSYDSSLDYSETDPGPDGGNLYSNGTIRLLDDATVYGQAIAHAYESSDDATLTGGYTETDHVWDNLTANVSTLKETVQTTNSNNLIDGPFLYDDAVLLLQGDDHLVLPEGVYYFGSVDLSGQCRLSIEGKVIIFCDNTIAISEETEVNIVGVPGDLTMFSFDRDISITDSARVVARLYAVNGCIGLSGQVEVFGRLCAAFIDMANQARLHVDSFASDIQLHFSVASLPDSDIPKQINVFEMMTTVVYEWQIDVRKTPANSHAHFNLFYKINGQWTTVGEKIALRGAGDYDLFCRLNEFNAVVEAAQENSVFTKLLQYEVDDNGQIHTGMLNFWRVWAYSWDNRSESSLTNDQYDQPWQYAGYSSASGRHIYDLRYPQDCTGLDDWECYWDRSARIQQDALQSGVILQMDLFDLCMPRLIKNGPPVEVFWHYNPFNPWNQVSEYRNELNFFTFDIIDFYSSFDGTPNFQKLKFQQEKTVEMMVNNLKHSGVTFFRIANEPLLNPGSTYEASRAVAFFNGVGQKAYNTFTVPLNSKAYLMAAMIYNTADNWNAHQNALWALFHGGSGFGGVTHPERIKIISYHQPYWLFNDDCSERIDDLTGWHDSNFETKAIIVDTDGTSYNCRNGSSEFPPGSGIIEPNMYGYAFRAFDETARDSTDFNCKVQYWKMPNYPLNEGAYLDYEELFFCQYQIDRAYDYWY